MESNTQRIPLWLDCDPGHDDACAILIAAHHPNLELLGISTVYGNASLTKTTHNALAVLEAIGKTCSVFPGSTKPFCRVVEASTDIHGESGLDGTDLLPDPTRKALTHCNAFDEMRKTLLSCPYNTAWLVATGTLTNVALLFAIYPDVAAHIRGLSIMGGAVGNGFTAVSMGPPYVDPAGNTHSRIGNKTPFAEFNIWCDPEAAQSIFANPILQPKTVMVPLDLTHQAYVGKEVQNTLLLGRKPGNTHATRVRRIFNDLLMFFGQAYAEVFGLTGGPPLHDPLAVAVLLHNHDSSTARIQFDDHAGERWKVQVALEGQEIGRTITERSETGVMIPRGLDLEKFWAVLEDCMARADEATGYQQRPV